MSTPLNVLSLFVRQTATDFYNAGLDVARLAGLAVTSWRSGDPTRVQFKYLAKALATLENTQVELAKGAFLSTAEGDWKTVRAQDVYNVTRTEATYATPTVDFTNSGGGLYAVEAGGLIVKSSTTNATYQNQETVTIEPSSTLAGALFVAQSPGSDGTVAADDIDTIVSPPLLGVTISSSSAAIGADEQSDDDLEDQCLGSLGALSPDGPADAYEYVVKNSALTGITGITRARSFGDTTDGTVQVYAATATTSLDGPTVAALQAAVDVWAQPLCTLATVASGTARSVNVSLSRLPLASSDEDAIEAAIVSYFATLNFGDVVAVSQIERYVHNAVPALTQVVVTVPSTFTLGDNEFPVLGVGTYT